MIKLLLWLFYRRIDTVGRERIPANGPVIVAANHHNAAVDAMLIVAISPRPVMVLANAPLFRHPLIGPFLRTMHAVPVNRRLEAGDDPQKNEAMFAASIGALREGGVLLIFPEGHTQPQPVLLPLRTGAARILLGAESADGGGCGARLLPVGMVFHDPGTFRSASVEVRIGEPVPTADLITAYRERPHEAVRALTARLTAAVRERIVEAEDHYTLGLLDTLERAWAEDQARRAEPQRTSSAEVERALAWKQRVMRGARYLAEREPHRVAEIRRRIELYRAHLDEVGLTSGQLGQPYTAGRVISYVLPNVLWLTLGLPLALWGIVCHAVPYWITGRTVQWLRRTVEEEATDKMAAGLVVYPLLWGVEASLAWLVAGVGGLVTFALFLAPSGLLALAWRERLSRAGRQARALLWFLADRNLHRRLLDERRALVEELRSLTDLAPTEAGGLRGDDAR